MDIDISNLDLLMLALAVVGYATGATLWTFFFRPVSDAENGTRKIQAVTSTNNKTVTDFFDDVHPREGWQKAPGTR